MSDRTHGNAVPERRAIVRPFEWGKDTFPPYSTVALMLGWEHHVEIPGKEQNKAAFSIAEREKQFRERFNKYRKEIEEMFKDGYSPTTISARFKIGREFMVQLLEEEMREEQKVKYPYLQRLRENAAKRKETTNTKEKR